jgi:hypothetical protein
VDGPAGGVATLAALAAGAESEVLSREGPASVAVLAGPLEAEAFGLYFFLRKWEVCFCEFAKCKEASQVPENVHKMVVDDSQMFPAFSLARVPSG